MKKISTILVLMLIALMMFVSCDNNTPKKDTSTENGSNNTQTEETPEETPKERAATDDDYTLFLNSYAVTIGDLENRIYNNINVPEGVTPSSDGSTSTLTFNSCEFDSFAFDGSPLHVKLNGSATRATKEGEENVSYYTVNITEGSSIGGIEYTLNTEFSMNSNDYTINIESIKINDVKIKGFGELANSKIKRDAKPADVVIAKKLIAAFNCLEKDMSLVNQLKDSGNLVIDTVSNESNTTYTYTFKNDCSFNFIFNEQECNVVFNGIAVEKYSGSNPVNFMCQLNYGTKIDDTFHSIYAVGQIDNKQEQTTYSFPLAIIDYTTITNLVV